jgi:hypothetical protein
MRTLAPKRLGRWLTFQMAAQLKTAYFQPVKSSLPLLSFLAGVPARTPALGYQLHHGG